LGGHSTAFARAGRLRTFDNFRPFQSGAEVTAVQTLARWHEAREPREALPIYCIGEQERAV
jgi:hypothetical protein